MMRSPNGIEQRTALELRAGAGRVLEGYSAVWDSPTRIADVFTETVRRGAMSASLANGKSFMPRTVAMDPMWAAAVSAGRPPRSTGL